MALQRHFARHLDKYEHKQLQVWHETPAETVSPPGCFYTSKVTLTRLRRLNIFSLNEVRKHKFV